MFLNCHKRLTSNSLKFKNSKSIFKSILNLKLKKNHEIQIVGQQLLINENIPQNR